MIQDTYATEKKVILFDQVHLQYYTSERMQSAISSLNNTGEYIVFINRQRFTQTSLLGVDILVVGCPGRPFTTQERIAISKYVKRGGNLFLLGDPRGKAVYLNEILATLEYTDAHFSEYVINDEKHNLYNVSTQIYISSEELRRSSPITNDIKEVVTHAIWVESEERTDVIATGSNYSFAGLDGSTKPAWLVAFTIGRAHIVLCGSTRMFSDLKITRADNTWYQTRDNARLWQNIFVWLSQKEEPPSFLEDITLSQTLLMVTALAMGIVFTGGGLGLYYLLQQREMRPISEILYVKKTREPQKIVPKEEKVSPQIMKEKPEKPIEKEPPPPKKRKKKKGKKRKYRIR